MERRETVPEPARLAGYLRATDGARIAAFGGAEALAPPTYCATWETVAALELLSLALESLPLGGVVHLESELLPLRALRPGDRVRCRVELERTEATARGLRLLLVARNWNAAEHLCSQSSAAFLVRPREAASVPPEERPADGAEDGEPPAGWEELARWGLRAGAGRRYALASGDFNPIHLWGWTARPFGFRRPILHGFCTEAMVANALVERRFRGDPTALRRLRVVFRAPLLLPARVRLLVGEEDGHQAFRVAGEDGRVYASGEFVGS